MSEIILPDSTNTEEQKQEQEELKYQATEKDEECFVLIYHLNMAPSEAYGLGEDHRKWILARFVMQKQMEREMMERQKLMHRIGGVEGIKAH